MSTLPLPVRAEEFHGRVAWVVGATGGLGRAIAAALAQAGARVALSGRDPDALAALAASLGGSAAHLSVAADVRQAPSVDAAAARIEHEAGAIDCLVNASTLPLFGDPLALDDETWLAVLDTKQLGYVRTMRAALPGMLRRGRGAIVNLSGRGGRQPNPVHLPGCSANAAVNLLTKGFADRYGPQGIRVNAVAPGPIATPRLESLKAAGAGAFMRAGAEGRPEDVANAAVFLLSDAARFINGTVLAVDGGSLAGV